MSSGNPNFSRGMIERRNKLLQKLKETDKKDHCKTLALFAIEEGISEKTVSEYYALLKRAGLI
jgi:hypothetical protein